MTLTQEQRALLTLRLVPGIGPKLCAAIVQRFGSAQAALAAPRSEWTQVPYLSQAIAEKLREALARGDVDRELELMQRHDVHLCFQGDLEYPPALATIDGAPQLLYVRGELRAGDERSIAIVGSRSCTSYGRRQAETIAADLARAGWTVVSGLARGIDGCAHKGALRGGGRTLAVLAGGLASIYPPEHAELAAEVAANGALITEAAMRMEPMAGMFPQRNRIITGLTRAVVVIEANDKSGALISARHAAEQGREVFALPANVDSHASEGTLDLLRRGARLVRHAADILEDLEGIAPIVAPEGGTAAPQPKAPPPTLTGVELAIWEFLSERRTVDEITRHLNASSGEAARHLFSLELNGAVRRLPGNWYERG